jgi:hypothetical protein
MQQQQDYQDQHYSNSSKLCMMELNEFNAEAAVAAGR